MISFSAIILSYNQAAFLKERIDSVVNQSYPYLEIIIIDDKSSDDSKLIIENYRTEKRIKTIIFNDENSGSPYGNWQKALAVANGDWIWIAEGDDFADSSFLSACEKQISQFPSAGICYSDSNILNEELHQVTGRYSERRNNIFRTTKWKSSYHQNGTKEINEFLKYDCTINNVSAMVFKKEIALPYLKEINKFRYYGDWFFYLHVCLHSEICYVSLPLNTYRFHSQSNLNAKTSILISKKEYFSILKLLINQPFVDKKKKLLTHFAYNYLAFGMLKTSIGDIISILKSYYKSDKKIAAKIILRIIFIKLLNNYYKRKYELKERPKED